MKWFYLASLAVVAALVLVPVLLLDAGAAEYSAEQVVSWDTYGSAVKSMDPATCGDTTSSGFQGNIYEGLYTYHFLKRPPEVVPQLAHGMPVVSEDGKVYTIRLKKGIQYHRNPCFGGDPNKPSTWKSREMTASDFELAMKRIADYHVNTGLAWAFLAGRIQGLDEYRNKTRAYKAGDFSRYGVPRRDDDGKLTQPSNKMAVEGIKTFPDDPYKLEIRLTEPYPQFIYVLAMHVYAPIPWELVDYWLAKGGTGKDLPMVQRNTEISAQPMVVGTGPYTLDTWKRKSLIVLKANPLFREDYYPRPTALKPDTTPDDDTDNEPLFSAKEIKELTDQGLFEDAGKRVPMIDIRHYDFVAESYSSWMLFLAKRKDASGIPSETFEFIITPDKDLATEWEDRGIYLTKYTVPAIYWFVFNMEDPVVGASKSLRQAMSLCYDVEAHAKVLFNGRAQRAMNIIPSTFDGHEQAGPSPYAKLDLELARKKIEDAKKELGQLGRLENGEIPEIKIDLPGQDAFFVRFGDFIKQQFDKIGLRVKVVYNDWPTLQRKVHNKVTQVYQMGWHADYPDAENFLQLYYSGNIDKGTNNSNYSNKKFDALYEKVRVMPDSPERTELYVQMTRMISEDCPVLLLTEPQGFVLFYEWVHNVLPHPIGYGFGKYRRIDTELRQKYDGGR